MSKSQADTYVDTFNMGGEVEHVKQNIKTFFPHLPGPLPLLIFPPRPPNTTPPAPDAVGHAWGMPNRMPEENVRINARKYVRIDAR